MRKLVFLTGEDMLDVDMPIVKELNAFYDKEYKITWVIVLKGYGWFKKDDLIQFCCINRIDYIIREQLTKIKNPLTVVFQLRILNLLKTLKPEIIYDSYLGISYMHFFRRLYLDKKLFVIAIHDVVQHYKMKNESIRTFYYSYLMNTYDYFHLLSHQQLNIFREKFINKNSFYSPLYLKDFGIQNKSEKLKDKKTTYFLFFGIIRANKGVDLLIEAANQLGERCNNFHIIIAGKCENWEVYNQLIKRPDLFTCDIRNLNNSEIPDLFAKAHFLLLPYRDVTQSGVLLTAYNYNLPVIASALEGFEEYVDDGKTGFLFECGKAYSLAGRMESALSLNFDAYQEMVVNLTGYISKNINIKEISRQYIEFFNTIKN